MNNIFSVAQFISLDENEIKSKLMHCCHCTSWVENIIESLKSVSTDIASKADLEQLLTTQWSKASEDDLMEAFSAHPRIGDIKVLRDKFATQAHTEQGQVKQADESVLELLMTLNDEYFEKFGFIFIICAKGKPAELMLEQLTLRLKNKRDTELANAAAEQEKIMLLRLNELVD